MWCRRAIIILNLVYKSYLYFLILGIVLLVYFDHEVV